MVGGNLGMRFWLWGGTNVQNCTPPSPFAISPEPKSITYTQKALAFLVSGIVQLRASKQWCGLANSSHLRRKWRTISYTVQMARENLSVGQMQLLKLEFGQAGMGCCQRPANRIDRSVIWFHMANPTICFWGRDIQAASSAPPTCTMLGAPNYLMGPLASKGGGGTSGRFSFS